MAAQTHRIRRQVVELTVASEAAGRRLQAEAGRIARRDMVRVIDRCCSEASRPGRLHRIERLEVDLGRIEGGDLEREILERLATRLPAILAEPIRRQDRDGRVASPELEILATFARTGSLPWWADATAPRPLGEAVAILQRDDATALAALVRQLARQRDALLRLVLHLDDGELAALADLLAPRAGARDLAELLGGAAGVEPARLRRAVWLGVLQTAALRRPGDDDRLGFRGEAISRVAREAGLSNRSALAALVAAVESVPRDREVPAVAEIARQLAAGGEASREAVPEAADLPERRTSDEAPGEPVDLTFADSDGAYVEHSGLVLLWPFLASCFERLELTAEKRFRDAAAAQRAVALLHVLATGETAAPEYLLTLEKVLCGLAPDAVLEQMTEPAEDEVEEYERLLAAVIDHAPELGLRSAAGLRGSFLLRPGVLAPAGDAWLLRVERRTYDLVLDRLSWTRNWVRLPWMPAPMKVEW
jgi:hypothetical protein